MSREDDFDDIMDSDEMESGTDDTSESLNLDSVDESEGDVESPETPAGTESVVEVVPAPPPRRPARRTNGCNCPCSLTRLPS